MTGHIRTVFLPLLIICTALMLYGGTSSYAAPEKTAYVLNITGAISPAVTDYVDKKFSEAVQAEADFIIIEMHTPGGLVTSMQDIIQHILNSPIPVITYVSPAGSHAASAGTYILYASHIAAMAPATNLGAATPVQMGGENAPDSNPAPLPETDASPPKPDAIVLKSINDAAAYIRELASLRGRNAEWAERAVRDAASLGAEDAKAQNVIDIVAHDLNNLMEQANGRTVSVKGENITLQTEGVTYIDARPDWRSQFLMIITDPNIAFLLMTIGFYGLVYEFANPGAFVPGIIGAIALTVGLLAMNILPVNYGGVLLLLFGITLMTAEAFIPAFGILGIAGAIAFALGGTILIDTDIFGFGVSWEMITLMTLISIILLAVVLNLVVRAHKRRVSTGEEALIGSEARIIDWSVDHGEVHTWGERWAARSSAPALYKRGDTVYIAGKDKLTLIITAEKPEI